MRAPNDILREEGGVAEPSAAEQARRFARLVEWFNDDPVAPAFDTADVEIRLHSTPPIVGAGVFAKRQLTGATRFAVPERKILMDVLLCGDVFPDSNNNTNTITNNSTAAAAKAVPLTSVDRAVCRLIHRLRQRFPHKVRVDHMTLSLMLAFIKQTSDSDSASSSSPSSSPLGRFLSFAPYVVSLPEFPPTPLCSFTEEDLSRGALSMGIAKHVRMFRRNCPDDYEWIRSEIDALDAAAAATAAENTQKEDSSLRSLPLSQLFRNFTAARYSWAQCHVLSRQFTCFDGGGRGAIVVNASNASPAEAMAPPAPAPAPDVFADSEGCMMPFLDIVNHDASKSKPNTTWIHSRTGYQTTDDNATSSTGDRRFVIALAGDVAPGAEVLHPYYGNTSNAATNFIRYGITGDPQLSHAACAWIALDAESASPCVADLFDYFARVGAWMRQVAANGTVLPRQPTAEVDLSFVCLSAPRVRDVVVEMARARVFEPDCATHRQMRRAAAPQLAEMLRRRIAPADMDTAREWVRVRVAAQIKSLSAFDHEDDACGADGGDEDDACGVKQQQQQSSSPNAGLIQAFHGEQLSVLKRILARLSK